MRKEVSIMARGSKTAYTTKQKRQARHIEKGYEKRGVPKRESQKRAWATVNKVSGGGLRSRAKTSGKKSGSGRGRKTTAASARRGGSRGSRRSK